MPSRTEQRFATLSPSLRNLIPFADPPDEPRPRLDLHRTSPKAIEELMSFQEFAGSGDLEPALLELVRTRVSHINGSAEGVRRHSQSARRLGEAEDRLRQLNTWQWASVYTERERAAFAWSAAVVEVGSGVPERAFQQARRWFSEQELVELTVVIVAVNAWNRVWTSFNSGAERTPD